MDSCEDARISDESATAPCIRKVARVSNLRAKGSSLSIRCSAMLAPLQAEYVESHFDLKGTIESLSRQSNRLSDEEVQQVQLLLEHLERASAKQSGLPASGRGRDPLSRRQAVHFPPQVAEATATALKVQKKREHVRSKSNLASKTGTPVAGAIFNTIDIAIAEEKQIAQADVKPETDNIPDNNGVKDGVARFPGDGDVAASQSEAEPHPSPRKRNDRTEVAQRLERLRLRAASVDREAASSPSLSPPVYLGIPPNGDARASFFGRSRSASTVTLSEDIDALDYFAKGSLESFEREDIERARAQTRSRKHSRTSSDAFRPARDPPSGIQSPAFRDGEWIKDFFRNSTVEVEPSPSDISEVSPTTPKKQGNALRDLKNKVKGDRSTTILDSIEESRPRRMFGGRVKSVVVNEAVAAEVSAPIPAPKSPSGRKRSRMKGMFNNFLPDGGVDGGAESPPNLTRLPRHQCT